MKQRLPPFKLRPVHKDHIWGGHSIAQRFGRKTDGNRIAESWEISARPEGESLVAGGSYEGWSLGELCKRFGAALLGAEAADSVFPLLVKLIDAAEPLSVQVHPDNWSAALMGDAPKTEMWYVLEAAPDACVYAGLSERMSGDALVERLEKGDTSALRRAKVAQGDALFIPGGLLHAIGAGCLILEVQQNSNTTYRVYDWNRVLADGSRRETHLHAALRVIRWDEPPPAVRRGTPLVVCAAGEWTELVECPHFWVGRVRIARECRLPVNGVSWYGCFVEQGAARIEVNGETVVASEGETVLIPADCVEARMTTEEVAVAIVMGTRKPQFT